MQTSSCVRACGDLYDIFGDAGRFVRGFISKAVGISILGKTTYLLWEVSAARGPNGLGMLRFSSGTFTRVTRYISIRSSESVQIYLP